MQLCSEVDVFLEEIINGNIYMIVNPKAFFFAICFALLCIAFD